MQLTIFNGSPRGKGSNSEVIIKWLTEGLQQNQGIDINAFYLNKTKEHQSYIGKLQASDIALIVFPLYTDCMPGVVMEFIEKLEPLRKSLPGVKIGFIVHSGFPEAAQLRYVEKYLEWLADELGVGYIGTVVMGGSEGIRTTSPEKMKGKIELFNELGRRLPQENKFNAELVKKISGMEKMGKIMASIFKLVTKTGIINVEWDRELKKNNVYNDRFAKPYAK